MKVESRVKDMGNPEQADSPDLAMRKARPIVKCDLVPKQKTHLGVVERARMARNTQQGHTSHGKEHCPPWSWTSSEPWGSSVPSRAPHS